MIWDDTSAQSVKRRPRVHLLCEGHSVLSQRLCAGLNDAAGDILRNGFRLSNHRDTQSDTRYSAMNQRHAQPMARHNATHVHLKTYYSYNFLGPQNNPKTILGFQALRNRAFKEVTCTASYWCQLNVSDQEPTLMLFPLFRKLVQSKRISKYYEIWCW